MTIVIVGGSGYIGTCISKKLIESEHTVIVIDIQAPSFTHQNLFFIQCDTSAQELPYDVLEKTDVVINLAGRTIATKWNTSIKEEIKNSRIKSTKHIVETIAHTKSKPSCFICASAVGFYGNTEKDCDELCPRGEGYLAEVVEAWEQEAQKATLYGVRTVCVRTAPVLGHGGFLKQLTKTARFGFLVNLTKKDFVFPWIHEDDIVATYLFAIETHTLQGVFNACAPEKITYKTLMKTLSRQLKRNIFGTLPRFVSKKIFGEFFDEMTKSQSVIPAKLMNKGFVFSYPTLTEALRAIYKKHD